MSSRGGGRVGGGGGGRRGGGDFNRGGRRGGRGGGGGRGGRGGDDRFQPISDLRSAPPSTRSDPASSSSYGSGPSPATVARGVESLAIRDPSPDRPADNALAVAATTSPVTPAPSSLKAMKHPPRPNFGAAGTKCVVRANHFLVEVADRDVHHYDVAITPEVRSRDVCRRIICQLVAAYKESNLGRLTPAYDGRKSLYTAGPLPFTSQQFKINYTERDRREKEYEITIKLAGKADLHHLQQFLLGKQFDAPQDTIQALDIVLREFPSQNYVTVSRSFFSPKFGDINYIGDGLECWRGYYQSLRPTQMGLSLNIDISATSFYKPVPVLEFAKDYLKVRDTSQRLTEKQRFGLKKALRGIRVEVTHRADCKRRYKITGLTNEPLSQLTFPVDDEGNRMLVTKYFQEKYQCQLRHITWPCIQAGSDSKPAYLPMEVCKIVEGQRFSKKLNEKQVTEILRSACQRPEQREKSIFGMLVQNNYIEDKYAREFGIKVANRLTSVEARVLPPPLLKYHDSGREKTCNPIVGVWSMRNKRMVNGGRIQSWACVSFSRLHGDVVYTFCQSLFGMCGSIGMAINPQPVMDILFERADNVEGALRKAHSQAMGALRGGPLQLLLIVLPEIGKPYGTIKRVCETELGLISQCCLPKHVQSWKPQYMENVALKINVKVGGRNTVLADALNKRIPLVTDKPTIIFGADVTHPPPGEDASASIAAVVASMDWPEVTKYRGLVSAQPHREEMIKDLFTSRQDAQKGVVSGGMVRELLMAFRRATNQKPHRIIFYRDGVSEGQFNHVLLYEMDAIRKACASLEEGYMPPVTFVVVQKRHHTRLFPEEHRGKLTDRSGNILPGTVVDRTICHPTEFDFYLCSHAGIQGTSRPAHYHVLYDENHFSADGLQILTNNLCYTYARCTRSVSVVPPAYYAHLAAFRARCYVEGESDGGSGTVGGTRSRSAEVRPLPQIKDNVKDVMFYC